MLAHSVNSLFDRVQNAYRSLLGTVMDRPLLSLSLVVVLGSSIFSLFGSLPQEYAPQEDRGSFRITATGPEGASFDHTLRISRAIEDVLMELDERGESKRVIVRIPGSFRSSGEVNSVAGTVHLAPWKDRTRSTQEIMADVDAKLAALPGYRAFTTARQGLGGRRGQALQFVITGSTFEELAGWRDQILDKAALNPGLQNVDSDYKETKPQFDVVIDIDRAADLGISLQAIGRTLETMMGSRRVTSYIDRGEEYDVILEAQEGDKATAQDMSNIYVRAGTTGDLVPLASVVTIEEFADSSTRNRFDRLRAITITASLADGYSLGEAL
jgi:multidrug efflux pump